MTDLLFPEALATPPSPATTNWVPVGPAGYPSGAEIGYDQITSTVTVASTTESAGTVVISGSPHTFDGGPVIAEFFTQNLGGPTLAGNFTILSLFEGATQIARIAQVKSESAGGSGVTANPTYRFTPTAGTHTYSVTAFMTGGTSGQVAAGVGGPGVNPPAFLRFRKVEMVAPPVPGVIAYGTSLPTAPTDGQEAVLVDNTTNPSYQWRFRYNAGSSSAYKWECVGGTPVEGRANGSVAVPTPGAWNNDSNAALQFTASRSGEYDVSFGCEFISATANNLYAMSMAIAGTVDFTLEASVYSPGTQSSVARPVSLVSVTSGQVVQAAYYAAAATNVQNRRFALIPRRVS